MHIYRESREPLGKNIMLFIKKYKTIQINFNSVKLKIMLRRSIIKRFKFDMKWKFSSLQDNINFKFHSLFYIYLYVL